MTAWVCITCVRICGQLPGDLEWWKGREDRVSLWRGRHPLPSLVTHSSSCLKKGRMRETRLKACILHYCFLLAHLTFGPNKRCDHRDGSSSDWGSCEGGPHSFQMSHDGKQRLSKQLERPLLKIADHVFLG